MERTCVGCHAVARPSELVRVVALPDGTLVPDARGGTLGRGAWVHPVARCVERAAPRGFARALKTDVRSDAEALCASLRAAGMRRLLGLVGAARRAKKAALGATAVEEALESGKARLVVVATDAQAAAKGPGVARAETEGRTLSVGTKAELGRAVGREELGVVAMLDEGFEAPLRAAHALVSLELSRSGRQSAREAS